MSSKKKAPETFQEKAHAKLTNGRDKAQKESDRANVPVIDAGKFEEARKAGAFGRLEGGDPWDGKKRLDAPVRSLRVAFTEEEIRERRVELEKRLAQTPGLRDQVHAAADAHKAAKDTLAAHVATSEGFSAITKQGWQYQDVECIEVVEKRAGGYVFAVTYRTDTGEEVTKREATKDELQESIAGV